jgi:hypothetical protein
MLRGGRSNGLDGRFECESGGGFEWEGEEAFRTPWRANEGPRVRRFSTRA